MKRDFMWYYSVIWMILGGLSLFWDMMTISDADAFWGLAVMVPTLIWIFRSAK